MQGKGAPSPAPYPQKRRFAHTGKNCAAVQILGWNLYRLTNYKAIPHKGLGSCENHAYQDRQSAKSPDRSSVRFYSQISSAKIPIYVAQVAFCNTSHIEGGISNIETLAAGLIPRIAKANGGTR